jgi:DNA-binding Lrp family transcriptional regulator
MPHQAWRRRGEAVDRGEDPLIGLVVDHPRITSRRIAEELGVAESTARTRLGRLIASGRLRPTVLVHPDVAGRPALASLRIQLEDSCSPESFLDAGVLATAPWSAREADSGALRVQVAAPDLDALTIVVDAVRSQPGALGIATSVLWRVHVGARWEADRPDDAIWASRPRRAVDVVDAALIALLRDDGRASFTSLGAAVGLTVTATRRRVLRLVEDGLIRFATLLDRPGALRSEASVDLDVRPDRLAAVTERLLRQDAVRYVVEQTGPWPLACFVVAPDTAELARAVASITVDVDVRDARTTPLLTVRDRMTWVEA